jgi:CheY-like chemotaxis protein
MQMKIHPPILIVDDDADVRELTRGVLELSGYGDILEARDGLEALRLLRDMLAPMVVLCDLQMPRQNGMQVIEALTSDPLGSPQHACVMVTANETLLSCAQRNLLRQHNIPVVRKPFELDELLDAVERAAARVGIGAIAADMPSRTRVFSGPHAP